MAQTNYTPIQIYHSTTASAVPTAANLVQGELAINTNDGKLYYEDSSGVVQVLATKSTGSIGGSNTQVQFNNSGSLGGSSGLTWDGSFLTTSSIKNSALTSGRVTYAGASGLLSDSAGLTYNGASLTISSGASASALIATSTSSGGTALNIQNNGTVNALIGGYLSCIGSGSATDVAIAAYQGALAFATNGANERMRIDTSGNLLVGKTATDVTTAGTQLESTGTVGITRDSATNLILNRKTSDGTIVSIRRDNTEVGSISATTTLTSYNVTSDERLKTNIVDAPLGNIDSIKVRSFDWIINGSHQEYGMVAQELIEVAPYAVTKTENPDDMMQVDYSKLVPMMIKEIQDLKQRIASLENK